MTSAADDADGLDPAPGQFLKTDDHTLLTVTNDGSTRVWRRDSAEGLRAWVGANRYIPALSCELQEQYGLVEKTTCRPDDIGT